MLTEIAGQDIADGIEVGAAMVCHHALGIARGARGVAQRNGVPFVVWHHPGKAGVAFAQQVLVFEIAEPFVTAAEPEQRVTAGGTHGAEIAQWNAGAAAHLPGVLASLTTLPVIGVPLAATPLAGFDSLLSIVQMPPGIPVATVAVGPMGARNAGHLAAEIIGLFDSDVAARIKEERARMRSKVQLPEGFTFE